MRTLFRNKKPTLGLPKPLLLFVCCLVLFCGVTVGVSAQQQVLVNLAPLDGVELTPENVLSYQLQSTLASTARVQVKGRLVYRSTGLSFSYTFPYTIQPGMNLIDAAQAHPQWTFSAPAFKELFMDYRKLPAGTYEYCVEVSLQGPGGELVGGSGNAECVFQKVNDVFLINLVDPENNAKLHEHYPVLSWMVNYPFASALTYKIRVAEVKQGQNNTAAVNRNNPVYQESNIMQPSVSYPVYARELETWQPYAWTVDAYYKGILLGGAEPWRFTIVEDSLMIAIPKETSYLNLKLEKGSNAVFAVGKLKLKYELTEALTDSLKLKLLSDGKEVPLKISGLSAKKGDNRYELEFTESPRLKHLKIYELEIENKMTEKYKVIFRYVNPDFIK